MSERRMLLRHITCPHCWESLTPSEILWVSASPDLIGDFRLGETEQQRFLPSRFNADGIAIDRKGFVCKSLACPHCHLVIPQSHLEMRPCFISIAGAPASGKSYFLTSMTWQLRKILPSCFATGFVDADPRMNLRLHDNEAMLFLNDEENRIHKLEKTQEQGDLYNTVRISDQMITYPQPFIFSMTPLANHMNVGIRQKISVSLSVYDNAGESYLPAQDSDRTILPVTRHLGQSNSIFFLFDPTQDNRFRDKCRACSDDPQLLPESSGSFRRSPLRQEMVMAEMIKRTRTYKRFSSGENYDNPLVVVVTKYDAWRNLLPNVQLTDPWERLQGRQISALSLPKIHEVSNAVRSLLQKETPEIIGMTEQFASDVVYIPVSATGGSPHVDANTGESGFRAKDIKPIWSEVPVLYAMARSTFGLIPLQK